MLNANRVILSLIFLACFQQVYAADISNFDIKGVSLGDRYIDIKGKIPCNNIESPYIESTYISCGKGTESEFFVLLDHDKRVGRVIRRIGFSLKPDYKDIKKQLVVKYGKPNLFSIITGRGKYQGKHFQEMMGWGEQCRLKRSDELTFKKSWFKGTEITCYGGKSLTVTYRDREGEGYHLELELEDHNRLRANQNWADKMNKRQEEILRKKESKLDI